MAPKPVPNPYRSPKIKKTIEKKKFDKAQCIERDKFIFLRCPLCFNYFGTSSVSATRCGHVFCTACLLASLIVRRRCPICLTLLLSTNAHQMLYLDTLVDEED